jgi:hypothetical protein
LADYDEDGETDAGFDESGLIMRMIRSSSSDSGSKLLAFMFP